MPLLLQASARWQAFLALSLCLQLLSWGLIFYWSRRRWSNHPISRALQALGSPQRPGWGAVATSINTEFRRIDKFATGAPGARVIVTDTWVMKVNKQHSSGRGCASVLQESIIDFLIILSRMCI